MVTCPVTRTEIPSALANPTSASAHPRTCDGPPGTWPAAGSRSAWIESTASRKGRAARAASTTAGSSRPDTNDRLEPSIPSRCARAETCRRDSSPDANRQGSPAADKLAAIWRRRVDLPMPGSPASSATVEGTSPPPRTRSMPGSPVETLRSSASSCASVSRGTGVEVGRAPPSSIVPQAPQPGHRPAHCASCCPHSRHDRIVRTLPMRGTVARGSDSTDRGCRRPRVGSGARWSDGRTLPGRRKIFSGVSTRDPRRPITDGLEAWRCRGFVRTGSAGWIRWTTPGPNDLRSPGRAPAGTLRVPAGDGRVARRLVRPRSAGA